MKKKNIKTILLASMAMTLLLILPVLANAAAVSWSTEQYTATAQSNIQSGTSLPIIASWTGSGPFWHNNASSNITSTSMTASATSWNPDYLVWGIGEFSGTYTATAVNPLFQFTYSGTSTINDYYNYAWLKVTDSTTSTVLYDNSSLTRDGNTYTIDVSTSAGHLIDVRFGTKSWADGYDANGFPTSETVSSTLNYSTAVAPEPISFILFVIGGTLMAGRRYLRRKA